ncbi:hypothetical protein M0802_002821 [Mischocyttarus mexicanus]|nr:hypothetical protein M0802_002821 [Mischocyttarus mexicanus]
MDLTDSDEDQCSPANVFYIIIMFRSCLGLLLASRRIRAGATSESRAILSRNVQTGWGSLKISEWYVALATMDLVLRKGHSSPV